MANKLYPIFLKLKDRRVLIIGGGFIAYQKLLGLLNTDAKLEVIAPLIRDEVLELDGEFPNKRNIKFSEREYEWGDEKGAFLVIAATNIPDLNNAIANRCKDQGILVNSVDEPSHCDFYVPSIVDREPVKIAITTNGVAPTVAQKIRLELEKNVEEKFIPLIPKIVDFREKVRAKITGFTNHNRRAKLIRWFTERLFKKEINV